MLVDGEYYLQRTIDNYYIYNYDTDVGIISDKEDVTRSYIKYIDEGETPSSCKLVYKIQKQNC